MHSVLAVANCVSSHDYRMTHVRRAHDANTTAFRRLSWFTAFAGGSSQISFVVTEAIGLCWCYREGTRIKVAMMKEHTWPSRTHKP